MKNIFLTGKLGKMFGKRWSLNVDTPAEAMHAIDTNTKGKFRKYLVGEGRDKYYKIAIQKKDLLITKDEIRSPSGKGDIYIMPTIKGANSGGAKILLGIALVAAAFISGGASIGVSGALLTSSGGALTLGIAASLILGGIVQLLTPVPGISENAASDQKTSSVFQGNSSTISQGGSVPIVYGRMLVSPMPIAISLTNTDQSTTLDSVGCVSERYLPDGTIEYSSCE